MFGSIATHPSQRMSLRWRMTLWTVAVTVPLHAVGLLFLLSQYRSSIESFFNDRLDGRLTLFAEALVQDQLPVSDMVLGNLIDKAPHVGLDEQFVLALYGHSGETLASSIRPPPAAERFALQEAFADGRVTPRRDRAPEFASTRESEPIGRVAVRTIRFKNGNTSALVIIADDRYTKVLVGSTRWLLGLLLAMGALATGVSAWLIAGLVIRPLRDLRVFARSLEPDQLNQPLATSQDASEVAEVRAQIGETREKLQAAFRSHERFMLNIGHELKTPIAVVLTEVETLVPNPSDEEIVTFARSVKEEMRRLAAVVELFSTLALVQSGKPVTHPRAYPLNEFVLEAVQVCQAGADVRKVVIDPVLEDSGAGAVVHGDPQLLRVMVESLLRNAIQHTSEGRSVLVTVAITDVGGAISVRDSGPTMPQDLIDRLFDRYAHPVSASPRARGFGMGLAVAKGIAEIHGGDIVFQNMPDAGCMFTITLPLVRPSRLASAAVP